jgi:hypothetical protein
MHDVADSFSRAVAVTPSDTTPISFGAAPPNPSYARRLYVPTSGSVTLVTLGGDTVEYLIQSEAVMTPIYIRINFVQVKATGTTCTNMVAEY